MSFHCYFPRVCATCVRYVCALRVCVAWRFVILGYPPVAEPAAQAALAADREGREKFGFARASSSPFEGRMSETLPPICREGVVLRFVFPFDASLSRTASVFWRSTHPKVDTWYADITQGGESSIVHEQVTFPGDAWVVYVKASPDKVLAYHVATGEREQRVLVAGEVAAPVEQPHPPAALTAAAPSALTGAEQEDEDLAAAIRLSLNPGGAATTSSSSSSGKLSAAAAAAAVGRRERQQILEAADPMAVAAALLGSRLQPSAPKTAEASGAGEVGVASAPAAEAEGDALLSQAMALSRELAAAHRAVGAARRSWLVATTEAEAAGGGGGGEARVRLQLTLPDGTRSTHDARHDTPLRSALRRLKASPGLGLLCGRTLRVCLAKGRHCAPWRPRRLSSPELAAGHATRGEH